MAGLMLQIKQIVFLWLLIGNGLLAAWAIVAYARSKATGPLYFRLLVFLQALVVVALGAGVGLLSAGVPTNWGHVLYAVLNGGLALGRVLAHGRLLDTGRKGLLWEAGLALIAVALVARSSVTAQF